MSTYNLISSSDKVRIELFMVDAIPISGAFCFKIVPGPDQEIDPLQSGSSSIVIWEFEPSLSNLYSITAFINKNDKISGNQFNIKRSITQNENPLQSDETDNPLVQRLSKTDGNNDYFYAEHMAFKA